MLRKSCQQGEQKFYLKFIIYYFLLRCVNVYSVSMFELSGWKSRWMFINDIYMIANEGYPRYI